MRNLKAVCSAAIVAIGIASSAQADEWNKLTLLTFSAPVELPGISLPAGTYRFELADPTTGRRIVRVSDKDGTKNLGIFLSMSNQRTEPSDKPVVMFQEAAAGAPQAVKVWFYPGETYGYEFVYPHDQALKIAKATHSSVLTMKSESTASTTEDDRVASMKDAEVTRVDENDRPVSTDAALKESSTPQTPVSTTASSTSTTPATQPTTDEPVTAGATTASTVALAPKPATAEPTTARPTTAEATTAQATPAAAASEPTTARPTTAEPPTAVGTSGTAPARAARESLPRTASQLPLLALFSLLALSGGVAARLARKAL